MAGLVLSSPARIFVIPASYAPGGRAGAGGRIAPARSFPFPGKRTAASVVAQDFRGMTTLPLWLPVAEAARGTITLTPLQIVGLLVAIVTGITGAVLGINNEIRRRRENKPDVVVRWEEEQYTDDARRSWIVVTNQGHVAVTIVYAFLKITNSSGEETTSRRGTNEIHKEIPLRLEPRDQKIIHVTPPFMFVRLETGEYAVVVTMVDGLGNHFDSVPFAVVQPGPSQEDRGART